MLLIPNQSKQWKNLAGECPFNRYLFIFKVIAVCIEGEGQRIVMGKNNNVSGGGRAEEEKNTGLQRKWKA